MTTNTLLIEQEAAEVRLAFEVHQNSAIQNIRLARSKITSNLLPDTPEHPIGIEFDFRSKQAESPPELLRIAVSFRMAGTPEGTKIPVVSVESVFEADYLLREGYVPTQAAASAFKDGTAIFNTWPYFREYLQSSLQRLGLPPLTAPFLRIQPKPPKRVAKAVSPSQ